MGDDLCPACGHARRRHHGFDLGNGVSNCFSGGCTCAGFAEHPASPCAPAGDVQQALPLAGEGE